MVVTTFFTIYILENKVLRAMEDGRIAFHSESKTLISTGESSSDSNNAQRRHDI